LNHQDTKGTKKILILDNVLNQIVGFDFLGVLGALGGKNHVVA
jgi:hypothetical protein